MSTRLGTGHNMIISSSAVPRYEDDVFQRAVIRSGVTQEPDY